MKLSQEEENQIKQEINKLLLLHTEYKNKLGIKQGSFKWIVMGLEEVDRLFQKFNIHSSYPFIALGRNILVIKGVEIKSWKSFLAFLFVKTKHIFQ